MPASTPTALPDAGREIPGPHGVALVPVTSGRLVAGNALVTNWSASGQPQGNSIVQVTPDGRVSAFAEIRPGDLAKCCACPGGVGLLTSIVVLRSGWVVVGSLPVSTGLAAAPQSGCIIILNNAGRVVQVLAGDLIDGPWHMIAYDGGCYAQLFVTSVLNGTVAASADPEEQGTVVRITLVIPPKQAPIEVARTAIGSGWSEVVEPGASVLGPAGLALGADGTLYVADAASGRMGAIDRALTRLDDAGLGRQVPADAFPASPLSLAVSPAGGIAVTQRDAGGEAHPTIPPNATAQATPATRSGATPSFTPTPRPSATPSPRPTPRPTETPARTPSPRPRPTPAPTLAAGAAARAVRVFVDPGHGGPDPGAVHADAAGRVDLLEKDVDLDISLRLAALLRAAGFEVLVARTADVAVMPGANADDELRARVDMANEWGADLFIDVHNNGHPDHALHGTEVYSCKDRPYSAANIRFANAVLAGMVASLRRAGYETLNRGAHDDTDVYAEHMGVLGPRIPRPTRMVAMLGESLFMTNDADAAQLARPEIRQAIAQGYADGIQAYLAGS